MERLVKRGEEIARTVERSKVREVADRLAGLLGRTEVDGSRVIVSRRGLMRRWLADSRLRFLASDLR